MKTRLFVRNLSSEATENEVYDLFAEMGRVEIILFLTNPLTNKSKGHCTIDMETEELARYAIKRMNGHLLHGQAMQVSATRPPNLRASPI